MSGLVAYPIQIGYYRVLRELGEGGMGTVYLAEDNRLDCRIALKILRVRKDEGAKAVDRFYREAQLAQSVQHPYICPVYEVGQLDGLHYLTMPFIEGTPLNQLISPESPWPEQRAAKVVRRVALALEALHQRQVLHRDLKPHNIMLRHNDEPMVMDLGLARSLEDAHPRLTTPGKTVGTPAYMPPELITGDASTLGPTADVYSLGVIFYELLTGHLPFNATNVMALFYQILSVLPPSATSVRPGLNEALVSICMRAMAKSPAHRFPRMAEMAEALNEYLQQLPDSFPPTLSPSLVRHSLREEQPNTPGPAEQLAVQTTETPTVVPQTVGGYDLGDKIARGGMGSVYKARHRETGQ
ncbi:MAG TPA: protein kinase, partial [Gemmataceae bacterium]|nr:protein kinase [Gemmataceae bacterium]